MKLARRTSITNSTTILDSKRGGRRGSVHYHTAQHIFDDSYTEVNKKEIYINILDKKHRKLNKMHKLLLSLLMPILNHTTRSKVNISYRDDYNTRNAISRIRIRSFILERTLTKSYWGLN